MAIKIKPCPFCGGRDADLVTKWDSRTKSRFYWVECNVCGGRGASKGVAEWDSEEPNFDSYTALMATRAWNRRAAEV